eukprot:4148975-Pyramimonas_sp.AAC.1
MAQGNEALAQMLLASLEADPTIRKTAEESLKQASKQPGTFTSECVFRSVCTPELAGFLFRSGSLCAPVMCRSVCY